MTALAANVVRYRQSDFDAIPGSPWVYWITPGLRRLFEELPKLGDLAKPVHGTTTYDNFRFLRFWWEVGIGTVCLQADSWEQFSRSGKSYVPYMKGGTSRRWYGNQEYVLQLLGKGEAFIIWLAENRDRIRGQDHIFRRGVTWTDITSGRFSARLSPGGFIFDVAGSSVFPEDVPLVLAAMNSTFAQYVLKLINPTVHVQVGDLARLPIPTRTSDTIHTLVEQVIELARAESAEDETTYDFEGRLTLNRLRTLCVNWIPAPTCPPGRWLVKAKISAADELTNDYI